MASYNPHSSYDVNSMFHQLQVESQIRQQQQRRQNQFPQTSYLHNVVVNAQNQLNQLQYQQEQLQSHSPKLPTDQIYPQTFPSRSPTMSNVNVNNNHSQYIPPHHRDNINNNAINNNHSQYIPPHHRDNIATYDIQAHIESLHKQQNAPEANKLLFKANKHKQKMQQNSNNKHRQKSRRDHRDHRDHRYHRNRRNHRDHNHGNNNKSHNNNNNNNTNVDAIVNMKTSSDYFASAINNPNFQSSNAGKYIKPATRGAANCFGNIAIDSMMSGIYEWKFRIDGDKASLGGTSVVIGVYGSETQNGYDPITPFYRCSGITVGCGYNIGQNRQPEQAGGLDTLKRRMCPNDTITMRLDLVNNSLSYRHNGHSLGAAFDGSVFFIKNQLNFFYRMAVRFGKNTQSRSIELLSFETNQELKDELIICSTAENHKCETQVIVKALKGNLMRFNAKSQEKIISIKIKIAMKTGTAPKQQRLIFAAKELDDDCIVSQYTLGNVLILHLVTSSPTQSPLHEQKNFEYENKKLDAINHFAKVASEFYHEEMDTIQQKLNDEKRKLESLEYELKKRIEGLENEKKDTVSNLNGNIKDLVKRIEEVENEKKYIALNLNVNIKDLKKRNERLFKSNVLMKQVICDTNKENECVVCMDLQRSHICYPCGHLACCKNCIKKINNICPMCQSECNDIIKVFK